MAAADPGKFVSEYSTTNDGENGHLTVVAISASAAQVVTTGIRSICEQRPQLFIKLGV
ncbi:hypothetical protein [Paraburkholderia aromaticivorans]|nr:hypothetical protein [Paraburkholderia aromaticivorans]